MWRLRQDLGFELEESVSLRHIAAHTTVERFEALRASYAAALRQELEADVPLGAAPVAVEAQP